MDAVKRATSFDKASLVNRSSSSVSQAIWLAPRLAGNDSLKTICFLPTTKTGFYILPEYIAALKQLADPPQSQISQIEAMLTVAVGSDKAKSYNNYIADPNDSTKNV